MWCYDLASEIEAFFSSILDCLLEMIILESTGTQLGFYWFFTISKFLF